MKKILSLAEESDLHKQMYISLLNSWTSHGSKKRLAEKAGISPVYLSYLLRFSSTRIPSLKLAKKISQALDVSNEERQRLLHHMNLANQKRMQSARMQQDIAQNPLSMLLIKQIEKLRTEALAISSPKLAGIKISIVESTSMQAIESRRINEKPVEFVNLCLLAQSCNLISNRLPEALWHAKLAHFIMKHLEVSDTKLNTKEFDTLYMRSVLAESICNYVLNLGKRAVELSEKALSSEIVKHEPRWQPYILCNKINSLIRINRFSIAEVENLYDLSKNTCEKYGNDHEINLYMFLNTVLLARAYLAHGNYRKAEKVIFSQVEWQCVKEKFGVFNYLRFQRVVAGFYLLTQNHSQWDDEINLARSIAYEGDFKHQQSIISKEMNHKVWLNN